MKKEIGICDVCEKELEITPQYGNMKFCDSCWLREQELTKQNEASAEVRVAEVIEREQKTIEINSVLRQSREIDNRIEVRTDLFNAATVAIIDLKKAIDSDENIVNKPYTLAQELLTRFEHFKKVIFDADKVKVEAANQQKAIQIYLNQMANTLRAEEREKLRIADINYKPSAIKPIVKEIKTRQTNKRTRIDKAELKKAANEIGISEFVIQAMVVQQGLELSEVIKKIKENMAAAKAVSSNS